MLTKKLIRHIQSLKDAAERRRSHSFLVEGPKLVQELLDTSLKISGVYGTTDWIQQHLSILEKSKIPFETITPVELEKISSLTTPNQVVAVVDIPPLTLDWNLINKDLTLMLDGIMDPGNLGTIIRIADWFGIGQLICSVGSVDLYNPKVVQATMGSIFRVKVFYENLSEFLSDLDEEVPVYGAVLEGRPVTEYHLPDHGILIIGSESHGISLPVLALVKNRLRIPSYAHPLHQYGAESLNASMATAILCYEFRFKGIKENPHC